MENKAPALKTHAQPARPRTQPTPAPSAFRSIAADSRVNAKEYVENFVAPGGGE